MGAAGCVVVLAFLGPLAGFRGLAAYAIFGIAILAAAAYMVWSVHPAWMLSAAFVLHVLAGNWSLLGIPGTVAPDRVLFAAAIASVVLRAPPIRDRSPLTFRAAHWALVLTLLWFVGSALAAETIEDQDAMFEIAERVGLLQLAVFAIAPAVFATEYHRRILLGAMVGLGAYLGFTALMETLNIDQLVYPSFITDPDLGIHPDRARGPFLEAVTNGAGLYIGVVGAAIALGVWREHRWRLVASAVLILCFVGLLFTETRSVWIAGTVATLVALMSTAELRRISIPAIGAGAAAIAVSIAIVPGLAGAIEDRREDDRTVWDRKNLATAAVNMVEAYPLIGIGWDRFAHESGDYFRVAQDYPLTGEEQIIHNVFLTYAAEVGLIGLGLWLAAIALGVIEALWPPSRGEPRLWQVGLLAYFVFFLVISNFVFPQPFPNVALWLLAGVAIAAADPAASRPREIRVARARA
jgi:O-antigen ligase